jgi:hypothetical protein
VLAVEHVHVRRPVGEEGRAAQDRRGVDRVVVAGQQVDRHGDVGHGLEVAEEDPPVEEVALEDVAAHDHEGAPLGGGQGADAADHVGAGGGEAGLRLAVEEVARHAELPVGGDDEPDHATPPPPSATPSVAARRRLRRG